MAHKTLLICALIASSTLFPARLLAGPPLSATENCDTNGDRVLDISDAGFLFGFLFLGRSAPVPFSGDGPFLVENGDCNGDMERDISDGIRLFEFLFLGGDPPVAHRPGSASLPPLSDTEKPAFVVLVQANRASGVPGTIFEVSAEVTMSNTPIATYRWSTDGGEFATGTASREFTFAEAGNHIVEVTAENAQGEQVVAGTLVSVFAADATPDERDSEIIPTTGQAGTFVQIRSSVLNDPAAHFEVAVGASARVEPFRPELGLANLLVPFDAADDLSEPTNVDVRLYADGALVETFAFVLSSAVDVPGVPGVVTRRWLEEGAQVLASIEGDLVNALTDLDADLTMEEQALVQALLQLAVARFEQVRAVVLPLLDDLDASRLTALDQILTANGVGPSLLDLPRDGAGGAAGDELIDLLCHVHEVMDELRSFISNVSSAANALPFLGLAVGGAAITPALIGMAKVVSDLGLVGDVLTEIQKLVPRVQDTLEVVVSPRQLPNEREKATVRVFASLLTKADICRDSIGRLIQEIAKNLATRLIRRVPLPGLAYFVEQRAGSLGGAHAGLETELQDFLRDAIQKVADALISAAGIDKLLKQARVKICALNDRNRVPLEPREELLRTSPGGAGTFLNQQEETIDFFCSLNTKGRVVITAERECGVAGGGRSRRKLKGQVDITCNKEPCTENALGSLETIQNFLPPAPRVSPCLSIQETLDFQVVEVEFRNTHPSRTIAVASVAVFESDKQDLPRGHCEDLRLDLCIDQTAAGCNSPPGLFLQPGEVSFLPYTFECRREFLFPPSGMCGDLEIETVTGFLIVQAVFCDDFDTARRAFCPLVDPFMVGSSEASPALPSLEVRPICP